MPEGSIAAPTAPSAPAASAPAAAPAAPVTPVAPAATPAATPETTTPVDAGTTTVETPAAPAAGGARGAEPKQADFDGDIVGFLDAHNAWERGEEGAAPGVTEETPAVTEETPPATETTEQPAETPKPAEPEQAVTPEALNALIGKSPELKAALEASPEVKNALFSMARINAKAAPILEIMPNVEAATFAAETSMKFVGHRTAFMEALDNPESMADAVKGFAAEFIETDKDGKPVMDAEGNPVYGEDFYMMTDYFADSRHDFDTEETEAELAANKFTSDDDREQADMFLQALKFVKDYRAGKNAGPKKPDLSNVSPELKAHYEQRERELAEREAKLGGKEKEQTSEQRKAEKATYETNVAKKIGGSVGGRLKQMVADDEKAGVFIPTYVVEAKDPQTGISLFAKNLLDQFEEATYGRVDRATGKVIGGVAHIRNTATMLARRPPSVDAETARVDFVNKLIDEHLPGIYEKEKRKVTNQEIEDRKKRQGNVDKRNEMTSREPRGGSAPTPKAMDAQTAMNEAYKQIDQKFPDISRPERTQKALLLKDQLMGIR